jgi:phage terminase Nu1 subunit (DNA packaging protein)
VIVIDLTQPMTQARFGELVGITQPAVSDLVSRGVLAVGAAAGTWLLAYTEHLREMAAGRGGEGGLELARERARLAREQADKIAMQNAVTRGELAPAHVLEEVLARAGARAGRVLETIPGEIKRRAPQLTSDDIGAIARIVAKARNVAAGLSLRDLTEDDAADGVDAARPETNLDDAA